MPVEFNQGIVAELRNSCRTARRPIVYGKHRDSHLPTEKEISVFDSLDERHAVRVFLGKDLQEAEAIFRENFLHYGEDLMWMGPKAFAFYVVAAIQYLLGAESKHDADALNAFCELLEFRMETEPFDLGGAESSICEAIRGILEDFDRFDFDTAVYGDVRARYRSLLDRLTG